MTITARERMSRSVAHDKPCLGREHASDRDGLIGRNGRAGQALHAVRAQQYGRTQVTALRAAGGELGSVEVTVEEHRVGQVARDRRLAKRATLEHGQALDSLD